MKVVLQIVVGCLIGVAATLVTLQYWGSRLNLEVESNAQPTVLKPFLETALERTALSNLPPPWFPGASSTEHDNWRIESLDGRRMRMADFRGKAVFLNFWNTTCAPCIAEMDSIGRLEKSLQNDSVAFVLVSPEKGGTVQKFVSDSKFTLPVFVATPDFPSDLRVQGYPTTYILNASGSIVYEHTGAANWDTDDARRFIREEAEEKRNP